jgi:hypothetical protein
LDLEAGRARPAENTCADAVCGDTKDNSGWVELIALGVVLAVFAATALGSRIGLPFVADDYVFLDKTQATSFASLWSRTASAEFGWYRPWSRELHFWLLQGLFGPNAEAFRIANIALWIAALCLYAAIIRRLSTPVTAFIATLGVASLAFWGTPLVWLSGSQDLWMLALGLLSLWLFLGGSDWLALPPFLLALLSKETAAILPALMCAYLLLVERRTLVQAVRRTRGFWAATFLWALIHPTLWARFSGKFSSAAELTYRPRAAILALKTLATCFSLGRLPHPQEVDAWFVARSIAGAVLLGGAALWAARRPRARVSDSRRACLALFAGAWALIGWVPLFLPSVGWHAYYGCVGALGLWFGLALWLEARPAIAAALLVSLALLREAQANTFSADWGDEAYAQTAGSTLAAIRADLMRQHPTLPLHSRVYVVNIPAHVGLIAGNSPALRVWYRDSTLQAGYFSYYRVRTASEPPGRDYFFRFDPGSGMVEIHAGEEDVGSALAANPNWERDHDALAALFLTHGDLAGAAGEYAKLSSLPGRPEAAILAAACYQEAGDATRAQLLLEAAQARLRASDERMQDLFASARREVLKLGSGGS